MMKKQPRLMQEVYIYKSHSGAHAPASVLTACHSAYLFKTISYQVLSLLFLAVACWTYDSRSVPPLEHFVNYLQVVDVVTTTKARVTSNGVSHVPLSHSLSGVISSGGLKQKPHVPTP